MKKKYTFFTALTIYTLSIINFQNPTLRFQNPLINYLFMYTVLLIPIYLTIKSFRFRRRIIKYSSMFLLSLVSFISVVFILLSSVYAFTIYDLGYDSSFESIQKIQADTYVVNVYLSNGGATTNYGIVVRQEKDLALGLMLVREIERKYPSQSVDCYLLDGDKLLIDGKPYSLNQYLY